MMEFFAGNHASIYYLLGGLSLVLELLVLGLSGPLMFFGVASLLTGVLVQMGVVSGLDKEIMTLGLLTAAAAAALWKPLKKLQGSEKVVEDTSSDMIGQQVPVSDVVTSVGGSIRHSGINWSARLHHSVDADQIEVGVQVEIRATRGNVMLVAPVVN